MYVDKNNLAHLLTFSGQTSICPSLWKFSCEALNGKAQIGFLIIYTKMLNSLSYVFDTCVNVEQRGTFLQTIDGQDFELLKV